ncbi:MAG TPA: hypothetical protein VMR21_14650 [Vicinamibacteria bacterium]|nr:hypothetical protein [Vicinamibacteria bacterium]
MVRTWTAGALALALLAGCEGGAETLTHSVLSVCLRVEQPTERVFRTAEEWRAFADPVARGPVPAPDFGQVMVAAHFDGTGSACVGFTVESVEESGGEVVVEATRHTSPDPCIAVLAYPQLVLTIERRDLPVRFRIRDVMDRVPGATPPCT